MNKHSPRWQVGHHGNQVTYRSESEKQSKQAKGNLNQSTWQCAQEKKKRDSNVENNWNIMNLIYHGWEIIIGKP